MPTNDPKQVLIDYLSNMRARREEQGCLAVVKTIHFLKVIALPNLQAYAVRYTSTTKQQWDEAHCIVKNVNGLWQCSRGFRSKTENRFVTTEEDRIMNGPQPWIKMSATEESGHWLIYGNIIANNYTVASIRMIPNFGQVEEDEIHDGLVFFFSKCTLPIEFEFYSPSHTLIGKQLWGLTSL